MSTFALRQEIADANRQTRRMTSWSFAAHTAALLLWLIYHQVSPQVPKLVEVEWIEPEPIVAAAPPPAPAADVVEEEPDPVPPVAKKMQRFERPEVAAETQPAPQRPDAANDLLRSRLDNLKAPSRSAPTLSNLRSERSYSTRPTTIQTNSRAREDLTRGQTQNAPVAPAELSRSSRSAPAPKLAHVDGSRVEATMPQVAKVDENTARRKLEGALLVGPVADRPLKSRTMPEYPVWAREKAVEASVTLSFVVAPDGTVRPNVVIQKTSGHADFDENARSALRAWKFSSLGSRGGDQWGTITFHFRLRG